MMAGDPPRLNPTVQIPSRDYTYKEDPTVHIHSTITHNALAALQRYLPSITNDVVIKVHDYDSDDLELPSDAFSCDNFRMFEFKVKNCLRARSHDWTECPFAHPGEKARRRDPRKFQYSGVACPEFRNGACRKGDACEYAHGVFECWLHPDRYRTQPCKDGSDCRRRVCFFAHAPEQLRVLPQFDSPDGSPGRIRCEQYRIGYDPFVIGLFGSSPKSTLYSPPSSPSTGSPPVALNSVSQLTESMSSLQFNRMKRGMSLSMSPPAWRSGFGSPRSSSTIRPEFMSLPSTPFRALNRAAVEPFAVWETSFEEKLVESGRELRERIYAKLGQENSLDRAGRVDSSGAVPDVGWVSELVQ